MRDLLASRIEPIAAWILMTSKRFCVFLIGLVLWDCIDDQCAAMYQAAQRDQSNLASPDDDDFIPFSLYYRAEILRDIRAVRRIPVDTQPALSFLEPPAREFLYLLMSLQI